MVKGGGGGGDAYLGGADGGGGNRARIQVDHLWGGVGQAEHQRSLTACTSFFFFSPLLQTTIQTQHSRIPQIPVIMEQDLKNTTCEEHAT